MELLFPKRRRWVTKHASGNYGVGATLVRWSVQEDGICTQCKIEEENPEHVFLCRHTSSQEVKKSFVNKVTEWCDQQNTAPDITRALKIGILQWLMGRRDIVCPQINYKVAEAFMEQTRIGWYNLVLDLPSTKWAVIQHGYLKLLGRRNTGKR